MADEKLDTQVRREQIAEAALSLVASHGVRTTEHRRRGPPRGIGALGHLPALQEQGRDARRGARPARTSAIADNVAAARRESADPLERLHDVFVRHVHFIREGRAFPRIIFSDEVFGGHPERKARVQAHPRPATWRNSSNSSARGNSRAASARNSRPETVALMFLGMVMPAGILWHLTDGGFNVTQHAGRAWQMFRDRRLPATSTKEP